MIGRFVYVMKRLDFLAELTTQLDSTADRPKTQIRCGGTFDVTRHEGGNLNKQLQPGEIGERFFRKAGCLDFDDGKIAVDATIAILRLFVTGISSEIQVDFNLKDQ